MDRETKKTTENTRNADTGRRDKGDDGVKKSNETKGVDYQVTIANGGTTRDAVKEDRG